MKTFRIENTRSGLVLGDYVAADEDSALDVMAQDAGYANFAAACEAVPGREEDYAVTEVAE